MGTAPDVVVYTQMLCGFCYQAKRLLDDRGVVYREIDVTGNPSLRAEMASVAGGAGTVPQIFIDGIHIGGSDDLAAAAASGKLDRLLGDD